MKVPRINEKRYAKPINVKNYDEHGELADMSKLPRQNEVIVVMDSVNYWVFNQAKTPNCRSIGKAVPAMSHSYYTPPSIEAMFRGAVPQPLDRCYWPYGRYSTAGENVLIPATMKKKGYNTYLLSSNLLIAVNEICAGKDVVASNINSFQYEFLNSFKIKSSPDMVQWFLDNVKEPYFVFMLLIETHTPYMGIRGHAGYTMDNQVKAVEYIDKHLGTLFQGIRSRKRKHKTRVIITADHGEAWSPDGKENGGHNPKNLHQFIKHDRMKPLTRVFLINGVI